MKNWLKKLDRNSKLTALGILAVILLYVSASGVISSTFPLFQINGSDEVAHVDLIYQIYNGHLPKATDGVRYKPFIDRGGAGFQRAAGHPPLFHLIQAPIIGPLLNKGEWKQAMALGRAVNIFFGILCILALAWAGWLFGGYRKHLFAVAVPALAVLTYRFSRLNTDFAIDGLLSLWCTLTIVNWHKIIHNGLKTKYIIWLVVLSILGMGTKSSYAVFLPISSAVVIWACYQFGDKSVSKRLLKGVLISAGLALAVILATGWYYYLWNYKVSGNFFSQLTDSQLASQTSRTIHTYRQIIASSEFWSLFYARYSPYAAISTAITTLAVAGWFTVNTTWALIKKEARKMTPEALDVAVLILAFLGTLLVQLKLSHPRGSLNFRYMLPAIFPISLFLSYGLLQFERLRGQLVALSAIALAGSTILSVRLKHTNDGIVPGFDKWPGTLKKIYNVAGGNGFPRFIIILLYLLFVIGAALIIYCFYGLTKVNKKIKRAHS